MLARHAVVVDDDADGREALAQLLEAQGYTVRQAENGRVALDLIAVAQASAIESVNDMWGVLSTSRIALLPHQLSCLQFRSGFAYLVFRFLCADPFQQFRYPLFE